MNVDQARIVLEVYAARRGLRDPKAERQATEARKKLSAWLTPRQRRFVVDPSKKKGAICGRRAGKTWMAGAYLLIVALLIPGCKTLYIHLTRGNAKRQLWPVLKRLNQAMRLGMVFNNTELEATLPNGSVVQLGGASDSAEIDKYRGDKYALVLIDEAASMGAWLEELVEEVLEPALIDYDGTLCMIGTPAAHCTGVFHNHTYMGEQTTRTAEGVPNEYSVHHWTMLENPYLRRARSWLKRKKAAKQWADDNPIYLREYMGVWVRSDEALVYHYDPEINSYTELPDAFYGQNLGVDLGFDDSAAFAVTHYSEHQGEIYLGHHEKHAGWIPSEIGERIRELITEYERFGGFGRIVVDTGGLGKSIVEELKKRQDLPLHAAEKKNKHEYIELLNDDLRTGRLKVKADAPVLDEWGVLQWDENRKKEDPRFPNDLADSVLYSWRESLHWTYRPETPGPEEGSEAWYKAEEDKLEQQALEQMDQRIEAEGADWWDDEADGDPEGLWND